MRSLAIAFLLVSSLAACLSGSQARGLERECLHMIDLLPKQLRDLPITSCGRSEHPQVKRVVAMNVPARRVQVVHRELVQSLGVEPLRFVCCGYEAAPLTIDLPLGHPLNNDVPAGAFRAVSLSFLAPGFVGSGNHPAFVKLGEADATIRLELVDY